YVMQLIPGQGLQAVVRRWRHHQESGDRSQETVREIGAEDQDAGDTPRKSGSHARAASSLSPEPCPLSPEEGPEYGNWQFIAEIGSQAADALHYAHRQGVLHRDVKPANLLLDPAGRVWVADFGLAKLVEQEGLTASGDILGTLQYLPPESLSGDTDAR